MALGAAVFAGESLSGGAPVAEAAATPTCTTMKYVNRYGVGYHLPAASNGSTICVVGPANGGTKLVSVEVIQNAARAESYKFNIAKDGYYGEQTAGFIRYVQDEAEIAVDGIYGPQTCVETFWPVQVGSTIAVRPASCA
jgi:peptidoglycan hydrolase-like protein with peptidoglycan-binding domain